MHPDGPLGRSLDYTIVAFGRSASGPSLNRNDCPCHVVAGRSGWILLTLGTPRYESGNSPNINIRQGDSPARAAVAMFLCLAQYCHDVRKAC